MDRWSAAQVWAETWRRSWPARDSLPIAPLCAPTAKYATALFRAPHIGSPGALDYVTHVFTEETDARPWFGAPIVTWNRTEGGLEHATGWSELA